jgi:hypothetical protein
MRSARGAASLNRRACYDQSVRHALVLASLSLASLLLVSLWGLSFGATLYGNNVCWYGAGPEHPGLCAVVAQWGNALAVGLGVGAFAALVIMGMLGLVRRRVSREDDTDA